MMNKCAKFQKDSPSDKKLNSISRVQLNFRRRLILCTTLYRNLMQASNFGGTFGQLFLWIFLWNFHRRCLSTFSVSWCKKKNQKWPKTQMKDHGLNADSHIGDADGRACEFDVHALCAYWDGMPASFRWIVIFQCCQAPVFVRISTEIRGVFRSTEMQW